MAMSLVITPAVSSNVTGQPGPHGPHVTAAVELACSNALGRMILSKQIFYKLFKHYSIIIIPPNRSVLSLSAVNVEPCAGDSTEARQCYTPCPPGQIPEIYGYNLLPLLC